MLGVVFVLLVCFLRHGLIGGIEDLYKLAWQQRHAKVDRKRCAAFGMTAEEEQKAAQAALAREPLAACRHARDMRPASFPARSCRRADLTKRYGGLVANSDIDFTVYHGELRGVIGPNGAGKTTFFKMLTCEIPPTSGQIVFEGRDITGMDVTDVCQLGLTKSYQVNQLFTRLTVRENMTIAALAELRGKFRLDLLRNPSSALPGSTSRLSTRLNWWIWSSAPTRRSRSSPMARSAGSKSASRSPPARACCCSMSRSRA